MGGTNHATNDPKIEQRRYLEAVPNKPRLFNRIYKGKGIKERKGNKSQIKTRMMTYRYL
jgi:hypothetical protein